jgi:hypothetical protein
MSAVAGLDLGDKVWSEYETKQSILPIEQGLGDAIAINGAKDKLITGSGTSDLGGSGQRGAVLTWDLVGALWVEDVSARLLETDSLSGYYGGAVAISDDGLVLAVGAWNWGPDPEGRVFIYDWDTTVWTERNFIVATTDEFFDPEFGRMVQLSADGAILTVGCDQRDLLYIYEDDGIGGWTKNQVMTGPDLGTGWSLGFGNLHWLTPDAQRLLVLGYKDSLEAVIEFVNAGDNTFTLSGTTEFPSDFNLEWTRGMAVSPDCTKIVAGAKNVGHAGFSYQNVILLEWSGEAWVLNETGHIRDMAMDNSSFDNGAAIVWMDDTKIAWTSEPNGLPTSYDRNHEIKYYELGPAPFVVGDSSELVTGAIQRDYIDPAQLTPQRPPQIHLDPDGTEADWRYSVASHGAMSRDGLRLMNNDDADSLGVWWERETIYDSWTQMGFINEAQESPGFTGAFGDFGGDTSLSGDGNTVVSGIGSLTATSYLSDPQYTGAINYGGIATWKFNDLTREWDYKGWVQSTDAGSATQGNANGLNDDGTIMWMGSWGGIGTLFTRFEWDEGLDNWVQTGVTYEPPFNVGPSWSYWKEAWCGSASDDGTVFTLGVYENELSRTAIAMCVDWNGSVIARRGDLLFPFEYGYYATFLAIDMAGTTDTIYGHISQGQSDDSYVASWKWSGSEWVFDKEFVGPLYTGRFSYDFAMVCIIPSEESFVLYRHVLDVTGTNTGRLWDSAYWGLTVGEDEDYLVTYSPEDTGLNCYTKVADSAAVVQVGTMCVDWYAPPPVTPPDGGGGPIPPTGIGGQYNDPDAECVDGSWQDIYLSVKDSNPDYAAWLLENWYTTDFCNGITV